MSRPSSTCSVQKALRSDEENLKKAKMEVEVSCFCLKFSAFSEIPTFQDAGTDLIYRSLEATEEAIGCIRDGESVRREVTLELRNLQLSLHEDFERVC